MESEHLYYLSNGHYPYMEWVFPQCRRYTLHDNNVSAITGNDVNLYEMKYLLMKLPSPL